MTSRSAAIVRLTTSALAGALSVLGFAPFAIAVVPIVALALLFVQWQRARTPASAAAGGFAFGLGFFLAGTSWVYVSLHTFGGMPAWLTAIATFCFCAVVAVYPALAGWVARRLRREPVPEAGDALALLVVMPVCWTAGELLRGYLLTGFPWLGMGYSQVPGSPLTGYAPVLGSYGVTWAAATISGSLALAALRIASRQPPRRLLLPAALIVAATGVGALLRAVDWTAPAGPPVTVALLQGNIAQERKFDADVLPAIFAQYRRMVEKADARLIILPETAFPVFLHQIDPEYLDGLAKNALERNGDILFGVAIADPQARAYFNAVVSAGASPPQAYRKRHLVPFGEFLPWRPVFEWVLDVLQIPMADFTPGPPDPPTLDVAGQHLALGICYEDAFGGEMRRQLPGATLLVNVSNDAWFGGSLAAEQHYQLAQMRALEAGRMMLRANNTGVTGIIGVDGRTVSRVPSFVEATLSGIAQGRTGSTPYVRTGDWSVIAIVGATLAGLFVLVRRRAPLATESSSTPTTKGPS